ncbi:MAG: 4Fe-4S binding protein, partial [Muribaculaceae bacterium]|nr:4Fe-4S binding protein [Muribaculaceae bacterium]
MLQKIRIVLAAVCFTLITLLLLDFTGSLHCWLGWLAKVQLLPAVLALNAVVIVVLALLTLVFGRIYCSVICPLGVFQDIVSWIHGRKKKNRFSYSPAKNWLRYAMLVLLIVAVVLGLGIVIALLAPYGTYGRFVSTFLQPLYVLGNNVLASISEHFDSYAFYSKDVWLKSLPVLLVTLGVIVAIVVLAWKHGRTWCNSICPVGTTLSFLAR